MEFNAALEKITEQVQWLLENSNTEKRREKFSNQAFGMLQTLDIFFPEEDDKISSIWYEYRDRFNKLVF